MKKKKSKILEISNYPPPRGGWGLRIQQLKSKLEDMGHYCKVLNIGSNRKVKSTEYEDIQNGLDYIKKITIYAAKGYRIHMHMNGQSIKGFILTFISLFISILFSRRGVITFHAGTNQLYFPKDNNRAFIPVFFIIFLMSKKIICNDEKVKEKICKYGVRKSKVCPIPAFSAQYLEYKEVKFDNDLGSFFTDHSPILSSYIRLRPTFYIQTTIEALKILKKLYPKVGVIFMGSIEKAEDIDAQNLFNFVKKNALEYHIHWAGDVDHDKFLSILKQSKIFIRSYIYDGVCSSVLEALSLGIPVIACENDLRPKEVLIFQTGDAQDLVDKIKIVLENYNSFKQKLSKPIVEDTLSKEIDILINY